MGLKRRLPSTVTSNVAAATEVSDYAFPGSPCNLSLCRHSIFDLSICSLSATLSPGKQLWNRKQFGCIQDLGCRTSAAVIE